MRAHLLAPPTRCSSPPPGRRRERRRSLRVLATALVAAGAIACSDEPADTGRTLSESGWPAGDLELVAVRPASRASLALAHDDELWEVEIGDVAGRIKAQVAPDGAFAIRSIDLFLGRAEVGTGQWPTGLSLEAIELSSEGTHWCRCGPWSDGGSPPALEVAMVLEAALWTEGDRWLPLHLPVTAELGLGGDATALHIAGHGRGSPHAFPVAVDDMQLDVGFAAVE